ncbi:MAG: DNA repair protein RadA [Clostridia bacterium]|nr:DNA repair protein RadA [Clostridia bacterium]MBP3495644.1 DNA repair protein RadA [Clostridia bacterium]
MKDKKVYVCTECDYQSPKWMGQCPSCKKWNTLVEEAYTPAPVVKNQRASIISDASEPVLFKDMEMPKYIRSNTGISELDRVLGGGIVDGSVILLAGEPGIGKSTLLMQICSKIPSRVLYVSGEESKGQLKLRGERLGLNGDNTYFLTETNVDSVLNYTDKLSPSIIIIDSIQTMFDPSCTSIPGSINQVKECAVKFIAKAKSKGISIILVGHVNKEGTIAGPKILEHMVDAVLYFEGERIQSYRIIRAIKNRFGSTNEIGVFEMTDMGLIEVPNPSEMLLSGRPVGVSGSCAVCVMEGSRPIIAEIQALVTPTTFPAPRRTSNGVDYNRLCLLLAVLEKRLGLKFSQCDIYLNVVSGLRLDEPSIDLAVALALISSMKDIPIPQNVIAMGEIGLAGECRTISDVQKRLNESYRLGFDTIAIPYKCIDTKLKIPKGVSVIPIQAVYDALSLFKENKD